MHFFRTLHSAFSLYEENPGPTRAEKHQRSNKSQDLAKGVGASPGRVAWKVDYGSEKKRPQLSSAYSNRHAKAENRGLVRESLPNTLLSAPYHRFSSQDTYFNVPGLMLGNRSSINWSSRSFMRSSRVVAARVSFRSSNLKRVDMVRQFAVQ